MIKSMTGYGGAKGSAEGLSLSIELKSVNNRYLDVSVKLPRSFLFAEELIKAAVGRHISRGKVDVFVSVDSSASDDMVVRVNEPLLRGYMDALGAVAEKYGLENKQIVSVKVEGTGRETVFGDVVVRVSDKFSLAMHIDTDECNAAGISPNFTGEIID